jgi:hypothetical protein
MASPPLKKYYSLQNCYCHMMIKNKLLAFALERRKTFDSPLANHFSPVMQRSRSAPYHKEADFSLPGSFQPIVHTREPAIGLIAGHVQKFAFLGTDRTGLRGDLCLDGIPAVAAFPCVIRHLRRIARWHDLSPSVRLPSAVFYFLPYRRGTRWYIRTVPCSFQNPHRNLSRASAACFRLKGSSSNVNLFS